TSMASYYDNTFPNTIPQLFNDKGFISTAHHNYTDHYYPRNDFHPAIGFDQYKDAYAMGMIEEGEYEDSQPPWMSDLEMFEKTLDDVISDEPFFAYYLTVSGHLPYDETHETASEHYDKIIEIYEENDREIPEDESIVYHHAAHYDFDLALGYLMDTLEAEGLLDDTVIWIQSDHYAYGMNRDTISEIDTWKGTDETRLNMHNVPLSIHHSSLDGRTVSHTFSNIDVM
ncbi:sulfatase-like hydrolase/transferase, partial [Methanocalculus natronophilus]|uniref:sulfatase-like hydrolase/transferase n=1 Tax=Methanocalculus natronophilus TaxID=1262400 RepID=UPI0031B5856A